jgi:hypothetical protein
MKNRFIILTLLITVALSATGCGWMESGESEPNPRLSMFIGVDISGSFVNSGYFDDSIEFLAHYIYAHLNGLDDMEVPNVLFVSSIGGASENEPKTFYPIHTFENKSVEEIQEQLVTIFPKSQLNPFTDYNAFFEQIAQTVRNNNLVLRPISIVMVSDGIPDVKVDGETDYRSIDLSPLERLSRSVTIRLLYTNAVVGKNWQTQIPRRRVKIWTQDAKVMETWNDPNILIPDKPLTEQSRWFEWVKDNVDFGVRSIRVD